MRRDPSWLCPGIGQQLGGAPVHRGTPRSGEIVVDDALDQRMGERERVAAREDPRPDQLIKRAVHLAIAQLRQPRHEPLLGGRSEHRSSPGEFDRGFGGAAQAQESHARSPLGGERAYARRRGLNWLDPFGGEFGRQLGHVERVAAGPCVASQPELLLDGRSVGASQQCVGRRHAQSLEPGRSNARFGGDHVEQASGRMRLAVALSGDGEQRKSFASAQQVEPPAEGRVVAPMDVVEQQRERRALGQVAGEPVEPVLELGVVRRACL